MRISRMIPMIMPAPKPPSLEPPGVLTFVCPMRRCSPSALRVFRALDERQAGSMPKTLERAGELRGREEIRGRLPPLIDQGAAGTREERGEGIGWLPARRCDDDDPSRIELFAIALPHVARETVHEPADELREPALVLAGIPGPIAGHARRAGRISRDD